eukprot:748758-Hanusia_phi.AAC.3
MCENSHSSRRSGGHRYGQTGTETNSEHEAEHEKQRLFASPVAAKHAIQAVFVADGRRIAKQLEHRYR